MNDRRQRQPVKVISILGVTALYLLSLNLCSAGAILSAHLSRQKHAQAACHNEKTPSPRHCPDGACCINRPALPMEDSAKLNTDLTLCNLDLAFVSFQTLLPSPDLYNRTRLGHPLGFPCNSAILPNDAPRPPPILRT